ncbi:hypothetical protein [Labrenzia sp. OB1]|uniref:hypothetical protein n=1 Tax=Labrenzia sp. OB1 TaxID=1561204 RepID=UPI0007B2D2AF|nr:hypothetical protein [Labrenzia sp. OB1]KZM50317.1 hypothetical protein OA90_10465 [Labrenzia sp. OB1]
MTGTGNDNWTPAAPAVCLVEWSDALSESAANEMCERAAAALIGGDILQLRLNNAEDTKEIVFEKLSIRLEAIISRMKNTFKLPSETYVEFDQESCGTPVATFHKRRFLLPHSDGGHQSYLTPSRRHRPGFDARDRLFSNKWYFKRASHKMYQGFIITNTGQPPGTTYYYSLFAALELAYRHQTGDSDAGLGELAGFCERNIRNALDLRSTHRSRYPTIAAILGARDPEFHVLTSGPRAESELWPEQYASMPKLCEMADACPCGTCDGPGMRLFCHQCFECTGLSWPEFRDRLEVSAVADRYDLLMGNNLTLLHAADSATERTILPVCFVIDQPETIDYENWLASQWERSFGHLSAGDDGKFAERLCS